MDIYDIGLIIDKKHYGKLTSDADIRGLLLQATEYKKLDDCLLFYWNGVPNNDGVDQLKVFLYDDLDASNPEDFRFIIIDKNGDDWEDVGDWWDNPFGFRTVKRIEFSGVDNKKANKIDMATLRIYNTKPGATNCYNCNTILKNPMPGCSTMNYCPKCEP